MAVGDRCVIYTRVSTPAQATEDKSSPEYQAAQCREACEDRRYKVVRVIKEVDKRWEPDRVGLEEARQMIRDGEADVLMAQRMDRLTGEQAHLYIVLDDVKRHQGRLEFAELEIEDTTMGRFLLSVYALMSEVETERISARSRQGKQGAINAGLHLGRVPLGFRLEGKGKTRKLVPDDARVSLVRRIFGDVAEGVPTRELGRQLEAEGHRTSIGGKTWDPGSIREIIHNTKYKGVHRGGLTDTRKTTVDGRQKSVTRPRPEEDRGPVFHGPRLVPDDLWERANARLDRNKDESSRRNQNPETHLLRSGYAKCGVCGNNLIAKPAQAKRRPTYRCDNRRVQGCNSISARQDELDALVWSRVELVINSPAQALKKMIDQARDGTLDVRIVELEATTAKLSKRISGLMQGIASAWGDNDEPLAKELTSTKKPLDTALAEADTELADLREQLRRQAELEDLPGHLEAMWREDAVQFQSLAYAQRRNLLAQLGVKTEVLLAAPRTSVEDRTRITMQLAPELLYGWNEADGDWDFDLEDPVGEALNVLTPLSDEAKQQIAEAQAKLTPEQRKANEAFLKLTPKDRRKAIAEEDKQRVERWLAKLTPEQRQRREEWRKMTPKERKADIAKRIEERKSRSCRPAASARPFCDAATSAPGS